VSGGVPYSEEAEKSVIARMLTGGSKLTGEVIGTLLEPEHFYLPASKVLAAAIYDAYYGDEPIEPLSIGEVAAKRLAKVWKVDESECVVRVRQIAQNRQYTGNPIDHARVVKRHADFRLLLDLAHKIQEEVGEEESSPEEVAGRASQRATQIATNTLLTHEIVSFADLGRNYVRQAKALAKAKEEGLELGAYFGLDFIDKYTRGLQPTELLIASGEPGVGKSAIWWKAALGFATRQATRRLRPGETPIGTLVLSLEMAEPPSNQRIASTLTGIDGSVLREGELDENHLRSIIYEWGRRKDLPLWFNFASMMRAGQIRALVAEAIRRHNVGLIVIDHFRYFDMDRRMENQTQEDEEKARFLKEAIAKELNVAVICLAHTTKGIENQPDRRPNLSHLRGSGQVAAHADFVNFVYRPYAYATDEQKLTLNETDAELIWKKNRHGLDGIAPFFFEPSTMSIR
jgi:replicative DNA helicase